MDSRVLITGGTGLVGSAISQGIKLSSKDGDLRDLKSVMIRQQNRTVIDLRRTDLSSYIVVIPGHVKTSNASPVNPIS